MISLLIKALKNPRKALPFIKSALYPLFWQVLLGKNKLSYSPPSGFLSDIEGKALYTLARGVSHPYCIVEIGSYLGRSTSYLAAGAQEGILVFAVDAWIYDDMEGADVFTNFLNNTKPWHSRIIPIRSKSVQAAENWSGPPIGLLFIDGDHSYEVCCTDIQSWLPKLEPDAYVVFHDYPGWGVGQAVNQLVAPRCRQQMRFASLWVGKLKR